MINIIKTLSFMIIPLIILIVLLFALFKKTNSYECFVEGASGGFNIAIKIIPYLIAIMAAVSMFRASGALDCVGNFLSPLLNYFNIPKETIVLMLTRSLSGSATLGVFSDVVNSTGADSFASKLSAVIVGSSETTFYVLAVYFGSIGIKKMRHAVLVGILADVVGIIMSVIICRLLFL